jgi:hypothetical protein
LGRPACHPSCPFPPYAASEVPTTESMSTNEKTSVVEWSKLSVPLPAYRSRPCTDSERQVRRGSFSLERIKW